MLCKIKNPRIKQFCDTFARLFRENKERGVQNPRVGRMAALMAGYGKDSWSEVNSIQTADVMYNRMIKRPEVIQYLKELGLERIGRQWREIQTDNQG